MTKTINIAHHRRGDQQPSNHRLLDQPLNLSYKYIAVLEAEGTDAWDDDGGYTPPIVETTVNEKFAQEMRVRGARKQRAAKAYIPKESIKVVPIQRPAIMEVAMARLQGSTQDEQVIALEAQIAALKAKIAAKKRAEEQAVENQKRAEVEKQRAIARLAEIFDGKRLK